MRNEPVISKGPIMAEVPRTIVVSQDGGGDYRAIQPALDAARPGDTVLVRAGTYTEDVRLRQGVTLCGEGHEQTRVVAAVGNALWAQDVADVVVRDLSADGAGKSEHCAVWIASSSVTILGCVVSGAVHSGIEAKGSGQLVLRDSTIRGNQQDGVLIYQEAGALLEHNTLAENGLHGIEVKSRGRVTARENTIRGNQQTGAFIYDEGEALLEHNILAENGLQGIQVRSRGRLTARENTIRGNQNAGAFIFEEGEALLEHNLLTDNGLHGVEVRERGQLTLTANTLARNNPKGVWIKQESRAHLRHNIIASHTQEGIDATGNPGQTPAAEVVLEHNCLWENHPDY